MAPQNPRENTTSSDAKPATPSTQNPEASALNATAGTGSTSQPSAATVACHAAIERDKQRTRELWRGSEEGFQKYLELADTAVALEYWEERHEQREEKNNEKEKKSKVGKEEDGNGEDAGDGEVEDAEEDQLSDEEEFPWPSREVLALASVLLAWKIFNLHDESGVPDKFSPGT
ncbi:hypothetical protein BDW69DRAFT_186835 [Aspergillus filifer]